MGVAGRLAAVHALVLTFVLGVAALSLLNAFRAQSRDAITRGQTAELEAFAAAAGSRASGQSLSAFSASYLRSRALPDGELLAVVIPGQTLLGSSGSAPLLTTSQVKAFSTKPVTSGQRFTVELAGRDHQVIATPLRAGRTTLATVISARDLTRSEQDLNDVRDLVLGFAAVAVVAAILGGQLLLVQLLRRIRRVTSTAARIAGGDLSQRLDDRGSDDEVGELARTFDAMADRVSSAITAQRRMLSDVSHQLRTPLTVARGHLEVLARTGAADPAEVSETVGIVVDELDHMRALVEQLLLLGRAMEPEYLERGPVAVRGFTADLIDAARVLAPRDWRLDPGPDLVIEVDEAKLRGAVLNLISNAVHATQPGDVIGLTVGVVDGVVRFDVDDSGPGVPAERREILLERFARPGAADSEGTGLGLAIARAVAQGHGGQLALLDSPLGGLRARILLPATVIREAP
jgi:signal transduction histidine kinase